MKNGFIYWETGRTELVETQLENKDKFDIISFVNETFVSQNNPKSALEIAPAHSSGHKNFFDFVLRNVTEEDCEKFKSFLNQLGLKFSKVRFVEKSKRQ